MKYRNKMLMLAATLMTIFMLAGPVCAQDDGGETAVTLGFSAWDLYEFGPHYQDGTLSGPNIAVSKGKWTFAVNFISGTVENDLGEAFLGSEIGGQYDSERYEVNYEYDRMDIDALFKYYLGNTDALNASWAFLMGLKYHEYSGKEWFSSASEDFERDVDQTHIGCGIGFGVSVPLGNPETTPLSLDAAVNALLTNIDISMTNYDGGDEDMDFIGYGINGYIGLTLQLFERAYIAAGYRGQAMSSEEYEQSSISNSWYPIPETCGGIYVAGGITFYF